MLSKWPLFAAVFGLLTLRHLFPSEFKADLGNRAGAARPNQPQAAPSLNEELAKFRRVPMPFHSQGLSAREQDLVKKLVEASQYLEQIYWRQSDPDGLKLLRLARGQQGSAGCGPAAILDDQWQPLRSHSQQCSLCRHCPHVTRPRPVSARLDARGDGSLRSRASGAESGALRASNRRSPPSEGDRLVAVPYHVAYRPWLEPAAQALNEAAALSDDQKFANFLRLRAKALLDDDFYASDIAWIELENPKFDVIFAPYEVYLDDLLGVKTSYGAAVMIRNEEESRKLALFQKYVPEIRRRASHRAGGSALQGRPSLADGSYGHAVSRRRSAARLSGCGG